MAERVHTDFNSLFLIRTVERAVLLARIQGGIMIKTFVGIDIASEKIDVFIDSSNEYLTVSRSKDGLTELMKTLESLDVELIAMEATGGYEDFVACVLDENQYSIAIVNPKKVRDFAKALGKLAKTDKIDAKVLALFANKIKPPKTELLSKEQIHLKQLVRRRKSLMLIEQMERNHLRTESNNDVLETVNHVLDVLEDSLNDIEQKIDEAIAQSSNLSKAVEIMSSVPSVGKVVAQTILAELPEIGSLSRASIAALAGLAPFNCDSGLMKGKRRIWGGRSRVRDVLYMSAMVAIQYNPKIKEYYEQLQKRGKPKKVALIACMRKILLILNSMVKNQSFWNEF